MKQAIFVAGQKGGAGKSTFSRYLVDRHRHDGNRCAAYDADGQVGQMLQYYGSRDANGRLLPEQEPMTGIGYFDIRLERERDVLLEAIETGTEVALFDLPGGSMEELGKVLGTPHSLFAEYQRAGYEVTVAVVITPVLASVKTVIQAIEWFGDSVNHYVAVKNLAFAASDEFIIFDGLEENGQRRFGKGKEALLQRNGVVVEMPRLNPRTYALLDLHSLGYRKALDTPLITRTDRTRVLYWLRDMDTALMPVQAWFGFGGNKK